MKALLWVAILAPALASPLCLALARRGRMPAALVAVGSGVIALGASVVALLHGPVAAGADATVGTMPPLDAGLRIPLRLDGSGPVLVVLGAVTLVSLCVQLYATSYLRTDDRYPVFAGTVGLFTAAMILVVTSSDLILTLVGWEVMGWCSYLLIGHWSRKESARRASQKAFLVTRFADIGFVLGVVLLATGARSTAYGDVLSHWGAPGVNGTLRAAAVILLILGVLGKSAQIPFQDWLPDAMEGPTPASALIHAATMVAAGTFVLARLSPLLGESTAARAVLGISVSSTMILSGVLAFGQSDIKRLLAYSTVSQVAIMLSPLAAAGVAGSGPASFHLYAHAFFKALLFLGIGWLGLVGGGTAATALRGTARKSALVQVSFGFGLLALAGLPFVVGGLSKEHVVGVAFDAAREGDWVAIVVLVALLVTVVLTAAYSTRAWLVVMAPDSGRHGPENEQVVALEPATTGDDHHAPPSGVDPAVAVTLVLLLIGTVFGGLVLLTKLLDVNGAIDWALTGVTVVLIIIGALAAWLLSSGWSVDPAVRLVGPRMPLFDRGLGVDGLYLAVVAVPVLALAKLVRTVDDHVVDATALTGARSIDWLGRRGDDIHRPERPATGLVWVLAAAVLIGALGVLTWH